MNATSEDCDPEIVAGTLALYYACNKSTKAKVPHQAVASKLSEPYREYVKDILKKVRNAGFANVYPRGDKAYSINMRGIHFLRELGYI